MADKKKVKENFETGDSKEKDFEELVEESVKEAEEQAAAEVEETEETEDPDTEPEETEEGSEGEEEGSEETLSSGKKDKKDALIEDLQDRVKRQMAEFENFRKRTEKEKSQMFDMGQKNVIEKMLPVVDNFERGLAGATEGDAFAEGMSMIYKQILTTFEQLGVKEIEAVGKTFDPELHNAVMHIDDEAYGENEIVEVLQKGYTLHDSVIRHSMVKVAN